MQSGHTASSERHLAANNWRTNLHGWHGPEARQRVVLLATSQDDSMHLLPDVIAGQLVQLAQRDLPLEALAGRGRQAAATYTSVPAHRLSTMHSLPVNKPATS